MKQLFKKLGCWLFGHVWFVDAEMRKLLCTDCGKEMK